MLAVDAAEVIERFSARTASAEVAAFAKEIAAKANPHSPSRAKAFLFAACALGAFGETVGLALEAEAFHRLGDRAVLSPQDDGDVPAHEAHGQD